MRMKSTTIAVMVAALLLPFAAHEVDAEPADPAGEDVPECGTSWPQVRVYCGDCPDQDTITVGDPDNPIASACLGWP